MEINEKLRDLLNSEAFAKEVEGMKTAEDLQAALKQHGIEMTIDEIVELGGQLAHQMGMGKDGELSEDDLENVSGGGLWDWIKSLFNILAKKNSDDINDILSRL